MPRLTPEEVHKGRKVLEYPRPDALNGEALMEQLCAALGIDEPFLVDAGLAGDTLQISVPKGSRRDVVERVLKRHDGSRASDAWLKFRRLV